MKVYSLYHNDEFVASFPTKESAVFYGKQFYEDGWSCNIIEEYLSKSPFTYNIGSPYTPLTPSNPIPYVSPVISKPPAKYPDTYPDIYCGVKAEPYKDVRANWDNRVEGVDY
jgi:hypothetical protein